MPSLPTAVDRKSCTAITTTTRTRKWSPWADTQVTAGTALQRGPEPILSAGAVLQGGPQNGWLAGWLGLQRAAKVGPADSVSIGCAQGAVGPQPTNLQLYVHSTTLALLQTCS